MSGEAETTHTSSGLKRTVLWLVLLILAGGLFYLAKYTDITQKNEAVAQNDSVAESARESVHGVIGTEFGDLKVEFFPEYAPVAVRELTELTSSGYFDSDVYIESRPGLGFVIAKLGDSARNFEFKDEENSASSQRGSIAISRSTVSKAYLNNLFFGYVSRPDLEQYYTIIGQVTEGLELIENVAPGTRYKLRSFRLAGSPASELISRNIRQ